MAVKWIRRLLSGRKTTGPDSFGEPEKMLFQRLQMDMPDFMTEDPEILHQDARSLFILVQDVPMLAERFLGKGKAHNPMQIHYRYALIQIDRNDNLPREIVTLEENGLNCLFLCRFTEGAHVNLGHGSKYLDKGAFVNKAMEILGIWEAKGSGNDGVA